MKKLSLDKKWDFAYKSKLEIDSSKLPVIPAEDEFDLEMPVPSIWDDCPEAFEEYSKASKEIARNLFHVPLDIKFGKIPDEAVEGLIGDKAKKNPFLRELKYTMMADGSLPNIMGVGWYKCIIDMPLNMPINQIAYIEVGGVVLEAWVFVNKKFAKYHLGHSTPFKADISGFLAPGENELMICIGNTRMDRIGTSIRGFKGHSGGIYRGINLVLSEQVAINDAYFYTDEDMSQIHGSVKISGEIEGCILKWEVMDGNRCIKSDSLQASDITKWEFSSQDMHCWSEYDPKLYLIRLRLIREGEELYTLEQTFGLRRLTVDGMGLKLNGRKIFLRGATDHCYWPLTTTIPTDKQYCYKILSIIKDLGFNWIRCHTWVPSHEYLEAADELGLMVQVETPAKFEEQEWRDILLSCRRHPSVVIYCGGNEEVLDEKMIEHLKKMSKIRQELVPDSLFNPQESLRCVESCRTSDSNDSFGEHVIDEPFRHNPVRLKEVESFSDVLGAYAHSQLSYDSIYGDYRNVEKQLTAYTRPCLSHEIGIIGTYLDIALEKRYEKLRIGSDMFRITRESLEEKGLLDRAADYYIYSCKMHRLVRKHTIETARKTSLAGYDFLGPNDSHWARSGYPCGMMNEFFELKPGETEADILRYNNDCVVLLDIGNERNFKCGEKFDREAMISNFGQSDIKNASLSWRLEDEAGCVLCNGQKDIGKIPQGELVSLGNICFNFPELNDAAGMRLKVCIQGSRYVENDWELYCFPESKLGQEILNKLSEGNCSADDIVVASMLTEELLDSINEGADVLLIGPGGLPSMPVRFNPCMAGRPNGEQAIIIYPGNAADKYPAIGDYCGYSYYNMLENGHTYCFDDMPFLSFKPTIEVVSSFKKVQKLGALFTAKVGKGRLIASSFAYNENDTGCANYISTLIEYMQSNNFKPELEASASDLKALIANPIIKKAEFTTDMACDPNVQFIREQSDMAEKYFNRGQ